MTSASPSSSTLTPDAGREAIWKVVHEVWQLLDDSSEGPAGREIDEARWQAVSEAMDALEALVPESEGPFWGGYPVNHLWPRRPGPQGGAQTVLSDIAAERRRQVEVEGWSPGHDDEHTKGEMAQAGGCYAIGSSTVGWAIPGIGRKPDFKLVWPWDKKWWKPKAYRTNLIRAAALLVAEIERIDRLAPPKTSEPTDVQG